MSQAVGWWMIHASAVLQTVAAQNYACFGRGGVPRHDAAQPAASHPADLCVELFIRAPDNSVRFATLDMTLVLRESTMQHVTWSSYDAAQHMQTLWVWDFYRLLSHVVLRVADSPAESTPDSAWQTALDGIRTAAAGDSIALKVRSVCGDIHQSHTMGGPAIQWNPV